MIVWWQTAIVRVSSSQCPLVATKTSIRLPRLRYHLSLALLKLILSTLSWIARSAKGPGIYLHECGKNFTGLSWSSIASAHDERWFRSACKHFTPPVSNRSFISSANIVHSPSEKQDRARNFGDTALGKWEGRVYMGFEASLKHKDLDPS